MASSSGKSGEIRSPSNASEITKKAKSKLNFSLPQPLVTITAAQGSNKLKFTIHKNLMCHYSPFFEAAFNSAMAEGQTQSMELDDIEGATFGLFFNWLYTQEVEYPNAGVIKMLELGKLWNLGQRFIIPQLQNKAMSLLFQPKSPDDDIDPLCHLAFQAAETTPIQRFIINSLVSSSLSTFTSGNKDALGIMTLNCFSVGEHMAKDFVITLVEKLLVGGVAKIPSIDDLADYLVPERE